MYVISAKIRNKVPKKNKGFCDMIHKRDVVKKDAVF